MKETNNAAPAPNGENGTIHYSKGSKIIRGYHQRRVLNLLSDGKQYSVADISIALHLSDPRAIIRDLRNKGVVIDDVWCSAEHGGRFKRFFMQKGGMR